MGRNDPNTMDVEVSVFCAGAMKGVVAPVARQFEHERQGDCSVRLRFGAGGVLKAAAMAGDHVDVLVLPRHALDQLAAAGKVVPGSVIDVAQVRVGVGVRQEAANLDVSTVDALRQALVCARSIAYANPATGDSSGLHVADVLDRTGLAAQVRAKSILADLGLAVAGLVRDGKAELGITQASVIESCEGLKLAGLLPPELQKITTYSLGVSTKGDASATARSLAQALEQRFAADPKRAVR